MTKKEAKTIIGILCFADFGNPYVVLPLIREFMIFFPEFKELALEEFLKGSADYFDSVDVIAQEFYGVVSKRLIKKIIKKNKIEL